MTQQILDGMIKSISYNQQEILAAIVQLHCPWGIDCDPTYGRGGFYISGPRPEYCYDINPQSPGVEAADCRRLPLARASVRSIMFDPPFFPNGKGGIMETKYSAVATVPDLYDLYAQSLREFWRVLKGAGRLIFKCQDSVVGRENHFVHNYVMWQAELEGFKAIDLFVKLNKSAPVSPNQRDRQFFARKLHSYFLVFKKPGRRTWSLDPDG